MDNNSLKNSMSKVNSPDQDEENSGWTIYFDDFFNQQNQIENSCCFSSSVLESYLMSDASFSATRNKASENQQLISRFSQDERLSLKKRKNKAVTVDDDLEDTACSPSPTPNVCKLMSEYSEKGPDQNNNMDISEERKGSSSAKRIGVVSVINGRENEAEVKNRGGSISLSMIVDYL